MFECALEKLTGQKELPALFINGTFRGGYDQICSLVGEGKLGETARPQTESRGKEAVDVHPRA